MLAYSVRYLELRVTRFELLNQKTHSMFWHLGTRHGGIKDWCRLSANEHSRDTTRITQTEQSANSNLAELQR